MNTVIFDTNLLLDFFVFKDPKTSVLWEAAKERKFRTATCEGALSELEDVLKRPQFKVTPEQLEAVKEEFLHVAEVLPITVRCSICSRRIPPTRSGITANTRPRTTSSLIPPLWIKTS